MSIRNLYQALILSVFLLSCSQSDKRNVRESGDVRFDNTQSVQEILNQEGWEEQAISNGQFPDCYNFKSLKSDVDNYLLVKVGSGTDVAIKIMSAKNEKCIRFVYIKSKSSFKIKNLPEGLYYLKIAYGKHWYSKIENDRCVGKFVANPLYKKGSDILDYRIEETETGYSIPSYTLSLDVISSSPVNSFSSATISEEEFNH
jgi:hypothetical protein